MLQKTCTASYPNMAAASLDCSKAGRCPAPLRPGAKWVIGCACAYALAAGVLTLLGWLLKVPRLTDWIGSGISMFPNTAVAAVLCSAGLLFALRPGPAASAVAAACGATVALIGGATLLQHLTGLDFGIDGLLLKVSWGERAAVALGRMGPPACISYVLIGSAVMLRGVGGPLRRGIPALATGAVALSLLAVVGYLFQADPLFATAKLTGIALQTATVLLALGIALLASVPDLEPVHSLLQKNAAGVMLRRAVPFVLILPVILGWILVQGRTRNWVDRGMGTAMLVMALITLFCGVLWWCSKAVAAHERVSSLNEARFRIFFELGITGMTITSPEKGTIEVNDTCCELLGRTREELMTTDWTAWTHPGDLAGELRQYNRVLAGESDGYVLEKRFIRKDGQTIHALISVKCARRQDGSPEFVVALLQDITERKLAENKLQEATHALANANKDLEKRVQERTASLREAIAQMEEFSYTVSHDLRAPLRGMKVFTEALLQDHAPSMPEEAVDYLKRIAANAHRLDKMILDVLTFSRLARVELPLERVAADKLARQIVEQYPGMQSPQAEIHIDLLPDVIAHEPSLTQALSNLLNNAVKFVPPNVTPRVRVSAERRDGYVRLCVSDNGIGVDPRYQQRLFNMFERIHPGLRYEGTGVGLAIVRKAVERMGGRAGMESDGVNGSRFWIEVRPAVEEDK